MRFIAIGTLAFMWITVPVVLQSCCGGISGGDDVYYNIDNMSMSVHGSTTTGPTTPAKLADLSFLVGFQLTRAALEQAGGSALYACSPVPMISNQKIVAISITSDKDLATTAGTLNAGESLNFKFIVNSVGHIDDPVSDLINNPLLEDYISFSSEAVLSTQQTHTFTFRITLDNGRAFEMVTEPLVLLQG
jgi:hypothetical protein